MTTQQETREAFARISQWCARCPDLFDDVTFVAKFIDQHPPASTVSAETWQGPIECENGCPPQTVCDYCQRNLSTVEPDCEFPNAEPESVAPAVSDRIVEIALGAWNRACLSSGNPRDTMRAALEAAYPKLAAQAERVAGLQKSLDTLHGRKFSDRCYHALVSRAEAAEAQVASLVAEKAELCSTMESMGELQRTLLRENQALRNDGCPWRVTKGLTSICQPPKGHRDALARAEAAEQQLAASEREVAELRAELKRVTDLTHLVVARNGELRRLLEESHAALREAREDARAYRNRLVSEIVQHRDASTEYELAMADAESRANEFIDAFHARRAAHAATKDPTSKSTAKRVAALKGEEGKAG